MARAVEGVDEMEPFQSRYDWDEAFRQNPDEPVYEVTEEMKRRVHGYETAQDAQARTAAEEQLAVVADVQGP